MEWWSNGVLETGERTQFFTRTEPLRLCGEK